MRTITVIATLLAVVLSAACGGGDDGAAGTGTTAISIDEALASDSDEPVLVSGNLLAALDEVNLCDALAESNPPQCGGASLVVLGLDLDAVDNLVTEGAVSWTDRPIQLLGVVSDGTLTVSENAPE
jgi:hypothetical protein